MLNILLLDPNAFFQQPVPVTEIVTAIGGLGVAAYGVLDAIKSFLPHINRIGIVSIHRAVEALLPEENDSQPGNALGRARILNTVEANWINGVDLNNQKAVAKSLIKLHLSKDNARAVARECNVDEEAMVAIANAISGGDSLDAAQTDAHARFELILTAILDEAYQRSDQEYRNKTRGVAAAIALVLALAAGWSLNGTSAYWHSPDAALAAIAGLLATPLAPIAKDLSTALATAVNTMQQLKRKGL